MRRRKSLSDLAATDKQSVWKQFSRRGLLQLQLQGVASTYVLESSGKRICSCIHDSPERMCTGARLSFDINAKMSCNYTQGSSFHIMFSVHSLDRFYAIRYVLVDASTT